MKAKEKLIFSLIAFMIFSFINILLFLLIFFIPLIGFRDTKFYELFISPFFFCSFMFIFYYFFKKINILFYPLLVLILKSLFILPNYDMNSGDFLISGSTLFSQLFNIAQYFLQKSDFQSKLLEIIIHLVGMLLYQVFILSISKKLLVTAYTKLHFIFPKRT
jgi:hypothetical protein